MEKAYIIQWQQNNGQYIYLVFAETGKAAMTNLFSWKYSNHDTNHFVKMTVVMEVMAKYNDKNMIELGGMEE